MLLCVSAFGSGELGTGLRFEPNVGQSNTAVSFLARWSGHVLFVTPNGLTLRTRQSVSRVQFEGSNPAPVITGMDLLPAKIHYLTGSGEQWHRDVASYARVQYRDLYPGIDLVISGDQGYLRYDLVVNPGSDPSQVTMHFEGTGAIRYEANGDFVVQTPDGELRHTNPEVYQSDGHAASRVSACFRPAGQRDVTLAVDHYDSLQPLVMTYSTYLGGSGQDTATSIAVDASGNAYVTGWTESTDFPEVAGSRLGNPQGNDVYVAKLTAAGQLSYLTYLGGNGDDRAFGIAVDSSGSAVVAGWTYSTNFPVINAAQSSSGGGRDGFVAKLNTAGNGLVFSTYLGGSGQDNANAVAIDGQGNIYIAGETTSANFPVLGAYQAHNGGGDDAFVVKLNGNGVRQYGTYLGGPGDDRATAIAVDSSGYAYITGSTYSSNFPTVSAFQSRLGGGQDAFAAKIGLSGNSLVYSTYLGGSGGTVSAPESGNGIAVDASGCAYIAGSTSSSNFPTLNALQPSLDGSQDAFILKLSASGSALVYSTYLGGSSIDVATAIAVDSAGEAYVAGYTASSDFPVVNALQGASEGGYDGFFVEMNAAGSAVEMGTYLGGTGSDSISGVVLGPGGALYVAGQTLSGNFPTIAGIQILQPSPVAAFVGELQGTAVSQNVNLALGKAATQSSTLMASTGAGNAVDGNADGSFSDGSVTHTNDDANAWWEVDLGAAATINSIAIWNRTDCCASRLSDYWVFVSNAPFAASDTPSTLQGATGVWSNHQTTMPNPTTTVAAGGLQGRYVRIQLSGTNYLSLAEVQVLGVLTGASPSNLALHQAATQSSTLMLSTGAGNAVDGKTDGNFSDGSVTHTNDDANAWWEVDLGATATINSIAIWNRTDCCGSRLSDYWVFVSNTPFAASDTPSTLQGAAGMWSSHQTTMPNPTTTIAAGGVQGRYVRIQLSGTNYLALAEVQVLGVLTGASSTNLALHEAATQSSTLSGATASVAVDGDTDGNFWDGSVSHTNLDANAWWEVDLGASATINSVVIWNRTDSCNNRLTDYWVFISNVPFAASDTPSTLQGAAGVWSNHQTTMPNPTTTVAAGGVQGRYVRIQLSGTNYLALAEVQVLGK